MGESVSYPGVHGRTGRTVTVLVATLLAFFGLPGTSPAARAANSIVLPEQGTVVAGVLSLDQDAGESFSQFSQWVPDSQGICDPESCSPGYMVSLGSYAQDTEIILELIDDCGGGQLFSNDPYRAAVLSFGRGQWVVQWDVGPYQSGCQADGSFLDFVAIVAVLPGVGIPAGQTFGSGEGWTAPTPPGLKPSRSTRQPAATTRPPPTSTWPASGSPSPSPAATTRRMRRSARSARAGRSATTSGSRSPGTAT